MRAYALILVPVLVFAACDSSGGSGNPQVDAALLAAAECTGVSLEDAQNMVFGLIELLNNTTMLPPGYSFNPLTGAFTVPLDPGTLTGTITVTNGDIFDGPDVGDSVSVAWDLDRNGVTGAGTFGFAITQLDPDKFAMNGSGVINGSCVFNLDNVDLIFDISNLDDILVSGTVEFSTSQQMTGVVTFSEFSDFAGVDATFGGSNVSFDVNLDTFEPEF